MLNKFVIVLLLLLPPFANAEQVSGDRLQQLVDSWNLLSPEDAYDFMPEKLDYELMNNPEFQRKIEAAGEKINQSIDGSEIELAGFMVPIKIKGSDVSEFLLVPEAGQCIHVPPPPLSQTVFVDANKNPIKLRDIYIPVIVKGKISVETQENDISNSAANDSNPSDFIASQKFNSVNSGYTLTDITIDTLTYSDEGEF